jgi:SAM-dependent methyltransferase
MHARIYSEFRKIVSGFRPSGRVLEIGAVPDASSLIAMPELSHATELVGINLAPASSYKNFAIISGNANHMPMFADASFDCVLCNATLEHDPYFWLTCGEIRRVIKQGGLAIIGVPSYAKNGDLLTTKISRSLRSMFGDRLSLGVLNATLTFREHYGPGDYYRFSEMSCREILLGGFRDVTVRSIMVPPRTISFGFRM